MRRDNNTAGNAELPLTAKVPYFCELVGNVFENPLDHLHRVGLRFHALSEHFLTQESDFEMFKFALAESAKLASEKGIFIPSQFRDSFNAAVDNFEKDISASPELGHLVESVKFAFALCDRDHPNTPSLRAIKRARSFSKVRDNLSEDSSLREVDAALDRALKIVSKLNRSCPDNLIQAISERIESIEYEQHVPLAVFKKLFRLCDSRESPAVSRELLFWASGPREDVGKEAAASIANFVNFIILKEKSGVSKESQPLNVISGLLYSANPEPWHHDDYGASVELLCHRLHSVDPRLFDSESIKALLSDLGLDKGDGGALVEI